MLLHVPLFFIGAVRLPAIIICFLKKRKVYDMELTHLNILDFSGNNLPPFPI
jgi:hypothetical protein